MVSVLGVKNVNTDDDENFSEEVCTPIPVAPHVNSDEGSAEQETDLEQEHAPKEDCRAPEEFFQKTLNQKYCHSMK